MKTQIIAVLAASLGLSGCGLFATSDQIAESRYAARDRLAHDGGPLFEGPMVEVGQLRDESESAVMDDDIAYDVWGGEDFRVTGPIDDDLGLHDGIVD
jgi:hypothetical protein